MALEYRKINKRGYQLQYGSVHSCKKCPYLTKSIFYMLNHVKCHKQQKNNFNCKNFPEIYSCKECDFTTNLTIRFNQHFKKLHSRKKRKETFACKLYRCKNCPFQSYSFLLWFKHHNGGCRREGRNSPSILERPILLQSKKNTLENTKISNPESRLKEDSAQNNRNSHSKNETSDPAQSKLNAPVANLPETHKWYKCRQCIFRTMSRQSLNNHRKTRHQRHQDSSQTFKCASCSFSTSNANHFRVHKLKHTSSFDCNKCSAKFSNLNALIRHKIKEHVDNVIRKNKCELCSFETDVHSDLVKHRKEVHPESHFSCKECSFMTRDKNQLKKHIVCKHSHGEDIEWVKCDFCPYKAKMVDTMKHHKKKHHSEEVEEEGEELLLLF